VYYHSLCLDPNRTEKHQIKELENIWKDYGRLYKADYKLCCHNRELFTAIKGMYLREIPKHLSGSTQTGSALARWFQECGATLMEWDIMYNVAVIEDGCNSFVDDIDDNPGYVKVRSIDQNVHDNCLYTSYHDSYENCLRGGFHIQPGPVKGKLRDQLSRELTGETKSSLEEVFKQVFQVDSVQCKLTTKENSVSVVFTLQSNNKKDKPVVCDSDNIAAIHCQIDWPSEAENWEATFNDNIKHLNDNLHVLSQKQASKIQHGGCHIVPKSLPNDPYSWRWSVSMAEAAVQSHFSAEQDLAFFITKVIFYSQKKEKLLDERFSSFFIKNIAFNVFVLQYGRRHERKPHNPDAEDYQPGFDWDEAIWMVMVLLQQIILGLEKKAIPHFFLTRCNLYDMLNPSTITQIINTFKNIKENITKKAISLPFSDLIDDVIARVDHISKEEEEFLRMLNTEMTDGVPHAKNWNAISGGMKNAPTIDSLTKINYIQEAFEVQHQQVKSYVAVQDRIKQIEDLSLNHSHRQDLPKLKDDLSKKEFNVSEFNLPCGRSLKVGRDSVEIVPAAQQGGDIQNVR